MHLVLLGTALFLLLHMAVALRLPQLAFHDQLKLSRGIASVLLTAIGFYALFRWFHLWPQAFIVRHGPDSLAWQLIAFVTGHFVADCLLLVWGERARGSSPRKDLLAHHALGLVACAVVFYYGVGHALFAVCLITEIMPVTSGLAALGPVLGIAAIERRATWLRFGVLTLWRMPYWMLMMALVARNMAAGEPDPLVALAQKVTLASMAVVMVLDVYWSILSLRALRGPAG